MRCGWRFGKSFLRAGLDCGHLTERQPGRRGRDRDLDAPSGGRHTEPEENDTEAAEAHERQPSRCAGPSSARHGRYRHGSDSRTQMLDRPGTGSGEDGARDRLESGHRKPRHRGQTAPRDRGPRASDTRDLLGSRAHGRRGLHRRGNGHGMRASTRAPARDAASPTGGPGRLRCPRRGPDRLGPRRNRRRRLLRRARLRLAHRPRRQE